MYVHYMYARYSASGWFGSLETGLIASCELLSECWELKSSSLTDQLFLT